MRLPIILAAGLLALSGYGVLHRESLTAAPTPARSIFESEIAPILEAQCAICHLTGQEAGNMSLVPDSALASLINVDAVGAKGVKRVVPGNPDTSYLIMKLEGSHGDVGGIGGRMPFGGPPLLPEQIAKFRKWIADGAK